MNPDDFDAFLKMVMNPYDFDTFLKEMAQLDYPEILIAAERIGMAAEKSGKSGRRGVVQVRKRGALDYSRRIGAFLFFMREGRRPDGVADEEFKKYLVVVRPLVEKGQFKPGVLGLFGEDAVDRD